LFLRCRSSRHGDANKPIARLSPVATALSVEGQHAICLLVLLLWCSGAPLSNRFDDGDIRGLFLFISQISRSLIVVLWCPVLQWHCIFEQQIVPGPPPLPLNFPVVNQAKKLVFLKLMHGNTTAQDGPLARERNRDSSTGALWPWCSSAPVPWLTRADRGDWNPARVGTRGSDFMQFDMRDKAFLLTGNGN